MASDKEIKVQWRAKDGTGIEFTLPSGSNSALLDLCEEAGISLPFGCRVGSCGSCRVQVLEGEELLSDRTFLEEDTLDRHKDAPDIRLACRIQIKAQDESPTISLVIKPATYPVH